MPEFPTSPVKSPEAVATLVRECLPGEFRLRDVLRAGRFSCRLADLRASEGGCEALLIPTKGNRFSIVVDPTPRGGFDEGHPCWRQTLLARLRFRIAHEIGHSFFYDRDGDVPARQGSGSRAEELFCDCFACALLVPLSVLPRIKVTPRAVFALAKRYKVSVEVVARVVAAYHPDLPRISLYYLPAGSRKPLLQWSSAGRGHLLRALNAPAAKMFSPVEPVSKRATAIEHVPRRQIIVIGP